MKNKVMMLAASMMGGCVTMPERMEFSQDIYGLPKESKCEDMKHQLWSMHCDMSGFSAEYFSKARSSARRVSALEWTSLATTLGVGGIVALGGAKDGTLSAGKLNTAENLTFGGAALTAGRQFYNPEGVRDTNLRAYYAFSCASAATLLALQREERVRQSVEEKKGVEELSGKLADARDLLATKVDDATDGERESLPEELNAAIKAATDLATRTIEEADKAVSRVDKNAGAYMTLPFRIVETRDAIYRQVLQRGISNTNALGSAYSAFQSTLQNQQSFLSTSSTIALPSTISFFSGSKAGPGDGGQGMGFGNEAPAPDTPTFSEEVAISVNQLNEAISDLKSATDHISRATPNIVTLSSHLDQCAAIVSTGVAVEAPDLEDVGPAMPPPKTSMMFTLDEVQLVQSGS